MAGCAALCVSAHPGRPDSRSASGGDRVSDPAAFPAGAAPPSCRLGPASPAAWWRWCMEVVSVGSELTWPGGVDRCRHSLSSPRRSPWLLPWRGLGFPWTLAWRQAASCLEQCTFSSGGWVAYSAFGSHGEGRPLSAGSGHGLHPVSPGLSVRHMKPWAEPVGEGSQPLGSSFPRLQSGATASWPALGWPP